MLKRANTLIMVSDMERAVRFYRDALAFKVTVRGDDEWAELEAPGLHLALRRSDEPVPPEVRRGAALGFQVDHLELAMAELGKKGITFAPEIVESHGTRLAFFADPDGTPMYLAQEMLPVQPGWD